jgi:hypothetical protein
MNTYIVLRMPFFDKNGMRKCHKNTINEETYQRLSWHLDNGNKVNNGNNVF